MKISWNPFLKVSLLFVALLLALNISGCATKPKPPFEVKDPENGLVYGNIYIHGREVTEVELREYGKLYIPPFRSPPRVLIFKNGNFVAENLKPGNYYISRFKSNKLEYNLVKDGRYAYQWTFNIEAGATKYIGAYEITDVEPGIFQAGKFKIRSVRHPSERKVLKHMYEITQGTGWQSRVRRKIKSLR